jgi:hypothetical protein
MMNFIKLYNYQLYINIIIIDINHIINYTL